jgi:hydroxylamine reductase
MSMFCYQCQETARNQGCTVRGVCGKEPEVAALQDLLIDLLKGISYFGVQARPLGVAHTDTDLFVAHALFSTITNVNFDADRFVELAREAVARRDALRTDLEAVLAGEGRALPADLPAAATWVPENDERVTYVARGMVAGVLADPALTEDVRSLRELLIYGLKGMAAYTSHAYVLEHENGAILSFMQEALAMTLDAAAGADQLVPMVLRCGSVGVQAMQLLDAANTGTFGHPEPTHVNLGVRPGPAILVSGHDLRDLDELLQETAGKGVNVYTHGEMLPANAYPALKKYPHLVGNYGGSWWHQQEEFEKFGGAILMTTNCLVPPKDSYRDRLFTTDVVGWPGVAHVGARPAGGQKDFSAVIARALECPGPQELESGTMPIGFAHHTVLNAAEQVLAAIQSGAIKRFVGMAGCDGRQRSREYFTAVAAGLNPDSVILTAGCAKYRYNKLGLGEINGIPRVLDAGQCNDSYSLVVIAQGLAAALGITDLNELPIEYDIAWYEQKAVLVLLALLSLGVKKIRLGPTLPAFVSPGVAQVLVDHFDLRPTATVEADLASIHAGA